MGYSWGDYDALVPYDISLVQRGHPQATQAGITDKQPDQNWDIEGFRGPENKNSNDSLNFPM